MRFDTFLVKHADKPVVHFERSMVSRYGHKWVSHEL
jgi:hypothetical protein